MKIFCASDLHFEFYKGAPPWLETWDTPADVIALVGDIGVGEGAVRAIEAIRERQPGVPIVWVAGNHEFYRGHYEEVLKRLTELSAEIDEVYFLENGKTEIQGYTFLGAILWTGFNSVDPDLMDEAMAKAHRSLNDFALIRTGDPERAFTPRDALRLHQDSVEWLSTMLASTDPPKTVVLTHFAPARAANHREIGEDLLTAYFQADCLELIERFQPALWLYGHNHYSLDIEIGQTRVASNQLGYPGEVVCNQRFDWEKLFELP